MNTILLNPQTWDLMVDASGNIAMASEPWSITQDVSSACRLFQGELWYDTAQGIPYLQQVLGQPLLVSFLAGQLEAAALTVPGVATANAFITGLVGRRLTGQVLITTTNGDTAVANL